MVLKPTDEMVRACLRRSLIVHLATLSPKRRPFVTPLWFVVHGDVLYITTGAGSWAGKNVMQHPDVALLFSGRQTGLPDRVLRLHGTATCHYGLPPWPALLRIAFKYYASPSALSVELTNASQWGLRQRYYRQAKGGVGHIRVVPSACELLPAP